MFQVYAIVPTYDDRDGINGSRAFVHPYNFLTLKGALAVARLKGEDADETYYVVRPVGMSPFFNGPHEFFRQQAQEERYGGCYVSAREADVKTGWAMDDVPF